MMGSRCRPVWAGRDGRAGRLISLLSPVGSGWGRGVAQAGAGGLLAAVASCSEAFCQGQPASRCRVIRAERASRPGPVMSYA